MYPGRYETAANLGTFYFHAGKLAEGLPHIDRALAINPDAHFGRERVQKRLVEYVVARNKAGALPLADVTVGPPDGGYDPHALDVTVKNTFADFLSPETRAAGMGVFFTVFYVMQVAGPWLAGSIAAAAGTASVSFYLGAFFLCAACVVLFIFWRLESVERLRPGVGAPEAVN